MAYRVEIARNAETELEELYRWVVARAPQQGARCPKGIKSSFAAFFHAPLPLTMARSSLKRCT